VIAGNDLRTMDATTRAMLTDADVLAVDEDWAGMQGNKSHRAATESAMALRCRRGILRISHAFRYRQFGTRRGYQ
jgi:ABC-type branched-subunit amino acid transport system ATPase component